MAASSTSRADAGFGFELQEIEQLIQLVESRNLAKLEMEESGRRIVIRGLRSAGSAGVRSHGDGAYAQAAAVERPANLTAVESPMVGVFYRGPSPDLPPYVEAGDRVELGQTIGMIEAMKVFSEIPSPLTGTVAEIPARNGALVHQGEPLMFVRVE